MPSAQGVEMVTRRTKYGYGMEPRKGAPACHCAKWATQKVHPTIIDPISENENLLV